MSRRNLTVYQITTVVTKHEVDVDVPKSVSTERFVDHMEETNGWVLEKGEVTEVSVRGREIMDFDTGCYWYFHEDPSEETDNENR